MLAKSVSIPELQYIRIGCDQGIRSDGRGQNDYRSMVIENDVFPHVNSSARIKISNAAEVICAISVDVDCPEINRPNEGLISFHVDISPSCNHGLDEKDIGILSLEVADKLQSAYYCSSLFPWNLLTIIPGKFVWHIKVDLLLLQIDGQPLDICSLASYVAFQKLRIPDFELTIGKNEISEVLQSFEISSDVSKSKFYNFDQSPIIVTLGKITGKSFIVDTSSEEQFASACLVMFAIDKSFACCYTSIVKPGVFQSQDLSIMLEKAILTAKALHGEIDTFQKSCSFLTEDEKVYADITPKRNGLLV